MESDQGGWQTASKRQKRTHGDAVGSDSEVGPAPPSPQPAGSTEPPAAETKRRKIKPLFVFLDQGHQYPRVYKALKDSLAEKFICQNRGRNEIMVHTGSITDYHRAVKALQAIGAQHSVLLQRDEVPKKFVLRGIHHDTPQDFLQQEFAALSLPVQNCWFLENRQRFQKCDALVIEVPQSCPTETIQALQEFAGMKIRVDDYRRPSGPVQCSNCQRFTHVGKGCAANVVCRWCSGPHKATECPNGGNPEHKKCALCEGKHCANYRGCSEYKKETRRHLPPDVRKAREQQSRRDIQANKRAEVQAQAEPLGPEAPPPPTFGDYMLQAGVNTYAPLQQHWEASHDDMAYPALANNPRPRGQRQTQPKNNWTGHNNGNGKPRQPAQDKLQSTQAAAAVPPKQAPRPAPRQAEPAQRQPAPPAAEHMAVDAAPVVQTAPAAPAPSAQPLQMEDMQNILQTSKAFQASSHMRQALAPLCQLIAIWCDLSKSMADKLRATMDCCVALADELTGSE
ncbi:uncharacterized protein LOC134543534 [Bacillus rossius redtenbacheri]|uniref:uncharacterized protein LOC134543534 n=1 Tax=Bacillus rossius redtenbacheri TaxID=93214 RepID=UPI002FDED549